jgi:hypothetical protein
LGSLITGFQVQPKAELGTAQAVLVVRMTVSERQDDLPGKRE